MSKDASKFDPRFDPAFQRGYDGPVTAAPREAPRETPRETARIGTPPGPRATERTVDRAPQNAPQPIDYTVTLDPHDEALDDAPAHRNPFLVALVVVAAALVVGGVMLAINLRTIFDDGTGASTVDWVIAQALMIATPIVICLGLATGIGVLFVYAVRWGRR